MSTELKTSTLRTLIDALRHFGLVGNESQEDRAKRRLKIYEDAANVMAYTITPRPLSEYHEDFSCVVWWTWEDGKWLEEPSYIGSPSCDDWPGYHTHWTPHPPFPEAPKS